MARVNLKSLSGLNFFRPKYHPTLKTTPLKTAARQARTLNTPHKTTRQYTTHLGPKPFEEYQYLELVDRVCKTGVETVDRTGTGTLSLFGASMRFSLAEGTLPLLTTKFTSFKAVLAELLFFLRGHTDNRLLNARGVHIWDANASAAAAASAAAGATAKAGAPRRKRLREGDLGPVYGFQWRHFGAPYTSCDADYRGKGVDQLQAVLEGLRSGEASRRLVVSAWNPAQQAEMALPPCHCLLQFRRAGTRLSCALYQRSADLGLGVPFNIASYALITHIVARLTGLDAHEFVHFIGDAHVYKDHVGPLEKQLRRRAYRFPKVKLREREYKGFDDLEEGDFELVGYRHHPKIEMKMSV